MPPLSEFGVYFRLAEARHFIEQGRAALAAPVEWSGVRRPEFPIDSIPKALHLMRWSRYTRERDRRDTELFSALCEEVGQHLRAITGAGA